MKVPLARFSVQSLFMRSLRYSKLIPQSIEMTILGLRRSDLTNGSNMADEVYCDSSYLFTENNVV